MNHQLLLATVAITAAVSSAPVWGQTGRLLGLVRDTEDRPLAGALVRVFPQPALALPWLGSAPATPASGMTDDRGRFSMVEERRAALWIEGGAVGAFLAETAPGVPFVIAAEPIGTLVLEPDAYGAYVRIDGVPVGFVQGREIKVPAGAVELLVETADGPFVRGLTLEPGERVPVERPEAHPALLHRMWTDAVATLPPWPERVFTPDREGTIRLPASDRPLSLRVTTPVDNGTTFDDLWLEAGEVRSLSEDPVAWRPIRVLDDSGEAVAGARVVTLSTGPGRPAVAAISQTDSRGTGGYRPGAASGRVVVVAEPFALTAIWPDQIEDVIRLEPGRVARLRIVDPGGQPVPGARVKTRIDPTVDQEAVTDARGGVELRQLPGGPIPILVDDRDHPPLEEEIGSPTTGILELTLGRGLEIHGVVTSSNPSSIGDVIVEVRDTFTRTRMQPRFTKTDSLGHFVFRGLPDCPLTLFARYIEGGRTSSGTARDVVPGGEPVTIAVESDDPIPGGRGRRGRRR